LDYTRAALCDRTERDNEEEDENNEE
jgi:hypothetical protein